MADQKITELTAHTSIIDTDVLPIVDITAGATKKTTWANIKSVLTTAFNSVYARLAGASGGQTLNGGTGSGDNLNLRSTSHATKGKIVFGAAGLTVYDEVNERFGFGTATPNEQIEITKNFRMPVTTGATVGVLMAGADRFMHLYGTQNVFIGKNAGNFSTSGTGGNVALGEEALLSVSTGFKNIGIGYQAGKNITTPQGNVAIGYVALQTATAPTNTFAMGVQALQNGTAFTSVVAIGTNAGRNLASGTNTVIIGEAVGAATSSDLSYSVVIGQGAANTSAGAGKITAIGQGALGTITSGLQNTAIGRRAGNNITTANNCIIIGSEVAAPSATTNGQMNIGNLLYGTGLENNPSSPTSTPVTAAKLGVGTSSPTAKVDIDSDIVRVRTAKTPASAGATGNAGDVCWDADYLYVCVATNTWKRTAIATW